MPTSSANPEHTPCPICGSRERRDFSGRRSAVCVNCGALERQRSLAAAARDVFEDGRGRSCLEIGPLTTEVFGEHLRSRGWDYTSADKWRSGNPADPRSVSFVDFEADIADLAPFGDHSFDLVLAQHVVEEVPDYRAALREVGRVLKAGGLALLEIPFNPNLSQSRAHPPNHFGNVWEFGADLRGQLEDAIGPVSEVALSEGDFHGTLFWCERLS